MDISGWRQNDLKVTSHQVALVINRGTRCRRVPGTWTCSWGTTDTRIRYWVSVSSGTRTQVVWLSGYPDNTQPCLGIQSDSTRGGESCVRKLYSLTELCILRNKYGWDRSFSNPLVPRNVNYQYTLPINGTQNQTNVPLSFN